MNLYENKRKIHFVVGESAGGGAVHFLMISPLSKGMQLLDLTLPVLFNLSTCHSIGLKLGLFHRAISQSGNVLNTWLYARYPKEQSQSLAKRVKCPSEPSEEMIKCLKQIDPKLIVDTHREMRVRT